MLAGCAPLSEQDLHLLGYQMHQTLLNQSIDAESTSKIIKKGIKYAPESYIGEPDIYLYLRELKLERVLCFFTTDLQSWGFKINPFKS